MKKRLLFLLLPVLFFSFKSIYSQTWRDMMEDPSVNFYSVQASFEQYWSDPARAVYVEVPNPNINSKWLQTSHAPTILKKKLPGWKSFKRWEDFMRPRLYPTGDRSVMINAMNSYFEDFYSNQNTQENRGMSGSGTPSTLAANWSIIGPTTNIPTGGGAGRVNFVRFDPSNTNIIWVGSPGGGLWNSTNGGTSWTTNTDNLAVIGCTDVAIHPTNNQIMYLATGDGDASDTYSVGVLKSTNGGASWSTTGLNWLVTNGRVINRLLINPVNPNTIFAATSNGVYRSLNAGANWSQIASAVANIKDIEYKPGDTTTVYAASTTRFYKSINGGTTFTNITSGLPATTVVNRLAIAVTSANPAYVYVLASLASNDGFQGLYRSTDNGTTFTSRSTTPNVLGWSSTGSDTGGQGWYDLAIAVSPTNADLVVVGGVNIWKSTTGGTSWTINGHWTGSGAPYVHADIHALEFIPGSATTYFAGCDGGLFRTTTAGSGWTDLSNGLQIAQVYRIGLSATNANLLLTGWQDNGTNRWSGTATWTRPLGGDGMEAAIDWSNANVQYGELYYGEINRTTTGGNLTTNIVGSGGTGVDADGDWVTPYILNPQKASTLIVGKAQAYRSMNRGTNWAALGTVTGGTGNLCALAYAPSDSNYIYTAKINKFYVSTNNGTSFTDRTGTLPVASAAITYIAVASNNPAHVWVTFSGYSAANKVWYSADAGVTWSNYTTGLPNLPANCIVYQNGSTTDVLYVGTDVGVYSRNNAAGSWTAYNTGLPNVSVRELEIQYGVSKLRAATFGRGIWQSDLATPGTSAPVADFSANRINICIGDCINFTDLSSGAPTSWSWSFPGAATTTSTVQNPTNICYNTSGTYNVTLTATNINGSNPITKTAYITVSGTIVLPLVEGFQSTYVPAGWALNNPDADNTWAQVTNAGGFATSTSSAMMDSYSPAATIVGTIDELVTPKYSFASVSAAQMTFDVAYARYNATYTDSLIVYVSTNCGVTWTAIYNKGGFTGLQTAPDNAASLFIPTAAQWRTETVNMTPYAGQANVSVKFTSRSGWGQALYLDNINITGAGSSVASVLIAQTTGTNPMCSGATATFTATPTNGGTAPVYQWQVNGSNVGTNSPIYTTTALTNGQIVTCIMTSNLAGVTGSPATSNAITMTVNATPATPAPTANSPVCSGSIINLTTTAVAGATYSWTGPSAFTSALQNPARTGATTAMAGTYSLTVTVNGCTSLAGTVAVVVNTNPVAPTASSNTPVCAGSTINLSASTVAGATYNWTGPSTFVSTTQNPTRPSATTAMAGTYSVTATVNGCVSPIGTTVVVVNSNPSTPVVTTNSPVCTGSSINLTTPTVAGAAYSWIGPLSYTSSLQNPVISAATPAMAGTYSLTVTTNGCTSASGTAAVVVNTAPAAPTASSNSPLCAGSTINLTASTVAGATYAWTGPAAFTSALQNPTRTTSTVAMSGTYSVTASIGGCTSPAGTTTVVVNALPTTPAATSNSPVCSGTNINLTTATVTGATYSWTGPSAFASTAQNPTIAGAATAMAGTYSLTVTVGGCTSMPGTASVIVNPTPAAPVAGSNSPVCAGSSINLTATTVAGATYSWSGPSAFTSAVQNPSRPSATAVMAGTYSVSATVNGCISAIATTAVVVNPTPATPVAGSNSAVCTGATINLTTPTVAGATYSWTGPSAFTSSVQNPTIAGATTAMAGTYSVTVTVSGCTSAVGTTAVLVNSSVTPSVTIAQTSGTNPMCSGASAAFTATATNGGTTPVYQWQVNGANVGTNSNVYTTSTLLNGQTVTCILASSSGCASPSIVTSTGITMTVNAIPSAPTAASNSPVCAGTSINLTATTVAGATYSWSGPAAFTSSLQNPSRPASTVAMAGTYSVTAISGGCASLAGTTTVVVNPIPATPVATSNSPVCTGSAINLTTSLAAGATYSWTGPAGFNSTLQNPSRPSVTAGMAGTYAVTITVSGCSSPAGTTVVTVNSSIIPAVSITQTAGTNPMCNGVSATFTATPTNGGATPSYQWQVNGSNVGTNSATYSSAVLTNGQTVTCIMTSSSSCASPVSATSGTITMVVNPIPSSPLAGSNSPVCSGSAINLTASTVSGATYSWTGPSGYSSALQNPTLSTATAAMAGTYSVTATVNGCTSSAATASVTINTSVTPSVSINQSSGTNPMCAGASSVFTASAVNGGSGAAYQWNVNGSPAGSGTTFTTSTLSDGDQISCVLTSNALCASPATAASNTITMTVNPVLNPGVSISLTSGSNPMCSGQPVSFTAAEVNGGSSPVYQWQVNNINVGTGSSVYSSAAIADGDVVTCTLISNAVCVSPANVTSTGITMNVSANVTPSINISATSSNTCQGDPVTFTASVTNEGAAPVYQWQVNGLNVGSNASSFSSSSLNNGDVVECILTSSSTCATPSIVNSNTTNMTVSPVPTTPVITQSGSVLTSSSPVDNQWYLDGTPIAGATGQSYTFLVNGNYTVVVTTSGCSSPSSLPTVISSVSINEFADSEQLLIYPNPNNGVFVLSFFAKNKSDYKIEIVNSIGQRVYFENIKDFSGSYSHQLNVVEFGQGIYTISLTNSENETVKKIIVY